MTPRAARLRAAARALVVAGAGAGLVLAATQAPALDLAPAPATGAATSAPPAAATNATLVCPGSELSGAEGLDDVALPGTVAAAVPPRGLVAGVGPAPGRTGTLAIGPLGADPATRAEGPTPVTVRSGYAGADPLAVRGTGARAPGLVAAQEWSASSSRVRGAGSVPCGPATAEAWLAAGGDAPGRQERLVLTNPGANPVTADVRMLGRHGPVDAPSGEDVAVPGGGRTVVLLDSLSATEAAPVVHVTTRGGLLLAAVNDTWVDGTDPVGSDDASATEAPSRRQVIAAAGIDGPASVRVAVPGSREGVVEVRLLFRDGPSAVPGGVTRVPAESVRDISLGNAPLGAVGVEVVADVPVVASALVRRSGSGPAGGDLAWASATAPVTRLAGTAFAAPAAAPDQVTLSLVASGGPVTAEVTTVDEAGRASSRAVDVVADGSAAVDVGGSASVWVRPAGGPGDLRAGIVTTSGPGPGAFVRSRPLSPARVRARDTTVVPLPGG